MNANPPLWTNAGLVQRHKPEVITLLDLHSCYAFWVELDKQWVNREGMLPDYRAPEVMRIRHRDDTRRDSEYLGSASYVDIPKDHWNNIGIWQDAIDLCVQQYRERLK